MCGINGYVLQSGAADAAPVARMNSRLLHRGPDEGGEIALQNVALGMRRLSIVDLASGSQPMSTEDGRFTLVYNGELYDHAEMRRELEGRGARFRTSSDTEVLLHSLAHRGEAALNVLNGMFGFALWDRDEASLLLARDPVGIKPLFYWAGPNGELVFSSELASLVEHPLVPRRLDRASLAMLLRDRTTADPWTLFDGVRQLPPGHLLRWRDGRIEVQRYWQLELAPEPMDEAEALASLEATLAESVRSQLVADVPVGVFLSGGVDSSTVAALAAREVRERTGGQVQSFNVGFSDPDFDESAIARAVAEHLGTEHHELRVEDASFDPTMLDRVVEHVGQPLADLSCIPTWLVSRHARDQVKCILSGDGGDEFFGGYDHMRWAARVRRVQERTPALVRRLGQAVLAGASHVSAGALATRTRRARKGLALTFEDPIEQVRATVGLFERDEVRRLLASPPLDEDRPWCRVSGESLAGLAPEELAMAVLAQTYMQSAILTKVDRMSMAASLEVRVPLLDRRVIDFALRCPLHLKLRRLPDGRVVGKHLLREAGRPLLPDVVYSHPKKGFGIPLHGWFNAEFWDRVEELYRPGRPAAALFDREELDATIARGRAAHRSGARISSQGAAGRVWLLAQFGRWMEHFEVAA